MYQESFKWTEYIFPNLSIPMIAMIITPLLIGTIICLALVEYKSRKNKKPQTILKIFLFSCILMISIYGYNLAKVAKLAIDHGCKDLRKYSISDISVSIENSPKQSVLPKNLNNSVLLYYRFGCKDCEKIFNKLQKYTESYNNVYWVSTQSKQGKWLKQKHQITKTPTGVYVKDDTNYVKLDLISSQDLDIDHLEALLSTLQ